MGVIEDVMKKELKKAAGEAAREEIEKVSGLVESATGIQRFKNMMFQEDLGNVKNEVITKVIWPKLKDLVHDAFVWGIDRWMYGGTKTPTSRTIQSGGSLVRVTTASGSTDYAGVSRANASRVQQKKRIDISNLVFADRARATEFVEFLQGEIAEHGNVDLAQAYEELTDQNTVAPSNYTDNYRGWTNLPGLASDYIHTCHYVDDEGLTQMGFKVVLPRMVQLDSTSVL